MSRVPGWDTLFPSDGGPLYVPCMLLSAVIALPLVLEAVERRGSTSLVDASGVGSAGHAAKSELADRQLDGHK